MRSTLAIVLATVLVSAGCENRQSDLSEFSQVQTVDGVAYAPSGEPRFDGMLLADQSTIKRVSSEDKVEKVNFAVMLGEAPKATAPAGDGDASGTGGTIADMASSLIGGLMGDKGNGSEAAGMPEITPEMMAAAAAAAEASGFAALRPEMATIPPNPGGRGDQGIEMAKNLGYNAAVSELKKKVFALPLPGGSKISDLLPPSTDPDGLDLKNVIIVGMKWNDADHLEVEVQVALTDAIAALEEMTKDIDFTPFKAMAAGVGMTAKGVGEIPENLKNSDRAGPGMRARRAAEMGGGI